MSPIFEIAPVILNPQGLTIGVWPGRGKLKVCRAHSPQCVCTVAKPSSAVLEDLPRRLGLGAARLPSRVRYLQFGSTAQSSAVQTFDQLNGAPSSGSSRV